MGKLTEAAKSILGEDSKSTFDGNIKAKMGQRGSDKHPNGEVGQDALPAKTAYGTNSAGIVGQSPETTDEHLPDYLKGTPQATPPGATPPVGSEKDGAGYATYKGQPQQTMGRSDVMHPATSNATDYEAIRDRIAGKLAPQTMPKNPGATFQNYGGQHEGFDFSDDVDALLEGENLSEEFKIKATTIFEAAVSTRIEQIAEQVEAQLTEQFESAIEQVKEEFAEKLDSYLNYMVEQWVEENQIALEKGLRAEVVEDFITGLHNLFKEHYIDIPEDKVDVVEELTAKVEQLESELNEEIKRSVELKANLSEQLKTEAIYTACEGLSQTQVEKLKALAESVEFTTEEEFVTKLKTLKESYFKADIKVANNSALDDEVLIEEEVKKPTYADPSMEIYAKTISQTLKV